MPPQAVSGGNSLVIRAIRIRCIRHRSGESFFLQCRSCKIYSYLGCKESTQRSFQVCRGVPDKRSGKSGLQRIHDGMEKLKVKARLEEHPIIQISLKALSSYK